MTRGACDVRALKASSPFVAFKEANDKVTDRDSPFLQQPYMMSQTLLVSISSQHLLINCSNDRIARRAPAHTLRFLIWS